jgi:hypothetical protein
MPRRKERGFLLKCDSLPIGSCSPMSGGLKASGYYLIPPTT